MFRKAFKELDAKKWFDRMQPQTVMIATWLLYIEGAFTFLYWLDGADVHGFWRQRGGFGSLLAFITVLCFPLSGFLMANGKKLGWFVGLAAAFSPLVLRALLKFDATTNLSWQDVVIGRSYVNFAFEAALCTLLLHPMSRNYIKTWLR